MESLNVFLLSIFAKDETFGRDLESFYRRSQTLSLIYVNLGVMSILISYNLISMLFLNSPDSYLIPAVGVPLGILSLVLLKKRKHEASVAVMLLSMCAANFIATSMSNAGMEAIMGIIIHPFFASFATSSINVHLLNTGFCGCLLYYNSEKIREIFEVTLNDEQSRQISLAIAGGKILVVVTCAVTILQKNMEINMRHLVQLNHKKSESVTKDVVEAMEAKDAFVSMLSHEIRNPLNALKGSIDYLGEVIKDPVYLQLIKTAKLSGEILLNLVTNVLDAAKLKSDKMDICPSETDIAEIIKKTFTINSDRFREKNLYGRALIDKHVPQRVWADPSRLLQIFMNLISNAMKFTPAGGKIDIYVSWCSLDQTRNSLLNPLSDRSKEKTLHTKNSVTQSTLVTTNDTTLSGHNASPIFDEYSFEESKCRLENFRSMSFSSVAFINKLIEPPCQKNLLPQNKPWTVYQGASLESQPAHSSFATCNRERSRTKGYLKVEISDTGKGIPADKLPKLFGMFEQVGQSARSEEGGTGLGLWICKQLCQRMNGDITIYSQPNKGTSFVFYILVDNEQITQSVNPVPVFPNKLKALVVDDYSVNRYLHSLLLEREGVQVTVVSNGQEAVEKYTKSQTDQFDLILMDIQMPEMDGFAAAKAIREWEFKSNRKKVEIYFVTGEYYNEQAVIAGFKNRGGPDEGIKCLRKPVDKEMIRRALEQCREQDD